MNRYAVALDTHTSRGVRRMKLEGDAGQVAVLSAKHGLVESISFYREGRLCDCWKMPTQAMIDEVAPGQCLRAMMAEQEVPC